MGPKLESHQVILNPLVTEKGTHQSTHAHHNAQAQWTRLGPVPPEVAGPLNERFQRAVRAAAKCGPKHRPVNKRNQSKTKPRRSGAKA